MTRVYPAKLLLFGEYTVLRGSHALAVPAPQWAGRWQQMASPDDTRTGEFAAYAAWLRERRLLPEAAIDRMLADHAAGWRYVANIPVGYGLGSSGAWVAAIYDRYFPGSGSADAEAPATMAQMEGYFHGASSGMDPLVALTRQAVFRDERGAFRLLADPGWPEGMWVYLFDSGAGRTTAPLVAAFRETWADPQVAGRIDRVLSPMNEHAIQYYLQGQQQLLLECLAVISHFQLTRMTALIPDNIRRYWESWTATGDIFVKLCGAGGGGYFLVVATRPVLQEALVPIFPLPAVSPTEK